MKKLLAYLNKQGGQVLPMALIVLALTGLVIGPFLSYGSTSLIGTRVRDDSIDAQYAADAGVEDAIWNLLYGDFTTTVVVDEGDTHSYTLDNTVEGQVDDPVNSLLPDITVTKVHADAVAGDDFNSGGWTGGTGWLADWTHSGDSGVVSNGTPYEGSHHLRLRRNTGYVERAADLSGMAYLHLTFWGKARSFEAGEEAYCKVSPNGTDWTTVYTWENGDDDNTYHEYDIDLSSFAPYSSQFRVAFEANMSGTGDYMYIDDLNIGRNFDVQPGGSGELATDNFETGWSGGSGWLYDWYRSGSVVLTGNQSPHEGVVHMRLRNTSYADRAADLSGQSGLHLTFWAKMRRWESSDEAYCMVSPDDSDWTTVQTWVNGDDDNVYRYYDIDLSSFTPYSAEFWVAFEMDGNHNSDHLYIDDLKITTGGIGGGAGAEYYDIVSTAGNIRINVTVVIDAGDLSIFSWEVS